MATFGLGDEKPADDKKAAKTADKAEKKPANSQSDEAKELLKKMKAKNDAGDCAFC